MSDKSYTFRIPDDLRQQLEQLAKDDNRSLANLIITILRQYVKSNPSKQD